MHNESTVRTGKERRRVKRIGQRNFVAAVHFSMSIGASDGEHHDAQAATIFDELVVEIEGKEERGAVDAADPSENRRRPARRRRWCCNCTRDGPDDGNNEAQGRTLLRIELMSSTTIERWVKQQRSRFDDCVVIAGMNQDRCSRSESGDDKLSNAHTHVVVGREERRQATTNDLNLTSQTSD